MEANLFGMCRFILHDWQMEMEAAGKPLYYILTSGPVAEYCSTGQDGAGPLKLGEAHDQKRSLYGEH